MPATAKVIKFPVSHKVRRKQRTAAGFGYLSYGFTEHDPILDVLQTVINDTTLNLTQIMKASGVSLGTIIRYRNKEVKSPRHSTVIAVLRACGAEEQIVHNGRTYVVGRRARKS